MAAMKAIMASRTAISIGFVVAPSKVRPLIHGADDAEMRVRLPRDESKKPPDLRREVFV